MIGLIPYMTTGRVHHVTPFTSMIQLIVAIATHDMPAENTTYELVHKLLLIGKDQFHINPAIIAIAPTAKSPFNRSSSGRCSPIHRPAKIPSIAVPIAGIVESGPSGSHVTELIHKWPPSRKRSVQAASVREGALLSVAPIPPIAPGTGTSVSTNQ